MWWEKVGNWDEKKKKKKKKKKKTCVGEREILRWEKKKRNRHGWERGNK